MHFGWLSASTQLAVWEAGLHPSPQRLLSIYLGLSYSVFHITVDSWVGPGFHFSAGFPAISLAVMDLRWPSYSDRSSADLF